jgi:hypothetical protein
VEVNEVKKLYSQRKNTLFSVFVSYGMRAQLDDNLNIIQKQWKNSRDPLLVFLVTFDVKNQRRWFYDLETYLAQNGRIRKIRTQPALPWDVQGTRWESNKNAILSKVSEAVFE